jgi:hypothetical protein
LERLSPSFGHDDHLSHKLTAALRQQIADGRPFNTATGTQPCILHANGWDKGPLLEFIEKSGRFTEEQAAQVSSECVHSLASLKYFVV